MLYIRMLFSMLVSLYTSRVILQTLGVEDYGIYNAVGGGIAMFSFINGAMANSTSRYITFALGEKNNKKLQTVFNISINIHIIIAIIIILLTEIIGIWFLEHKMQIPTDRMNAAYWVLQLSLLSSIVSIISVPYNSLIIAHERMDVFAYISIFEVILKLVIVYCLTIGNSDKLIIYALLLLIVQLLIRFIYKNYCNKHFKESRYQFSWDKELIKEMTSFAGWNLWGNFAYISYTQGVNLLFNVFWGPIINAARGISIQVQGLISQLANSLQSAINPQITKSYAAHNYQYMHELIYRSSRYTFYLLLIISVPILFEAPTLLKIWLTTIPEHTINFVRLTICCTIIDSVSNPLLTSAAATGKVRIYQFTIGGILLMILPLSYITLKLGGAPEMVYIVQLTIYIIAFIIRLFIIKPMIKLSLLKYTHEVIWHCFIISIIVISIPLIVKYILPNNWISFFLICFTCVIHTLITIYTIGLKRDEKQLIKTKIHYLIHKRFK